MNRAKKFFLGVTESGNFSLNERPYFLAGKGLLTAFFFLPPFSDSPYSFPAWFLSIIEGLYVIASFDLIIYSMVLLLLVFKRVPYYFRATTFVVLSFILGGILLYILRGMRSRCCLAFLCSHSFGHPPGAAGRNKRDWASMLWSSWSQGLFCTGKCRKPVMIWHLSFSGIVVGIKFYSSKYFCLPWLFLLSSRAFRLRSMLRKLFKLKYIRIFENMMGCIL